MNKNTIVRAEAKNGPNGSSLTFDKLTTANAYGNAKKEDNINATKLSLKPSIAPKTKDNLISPPPNDSLLNTKSPIFFITNISKNIKIPLAKDKIAVFKPK